MENIVRTIYGSTLQTAQLMGLPYVVKPYSTLNEKLAINATELITSTDVPTMRYAAIGNGGHQMVAGANGISRPMIVQHRTTDAALYNQLPFVLRELTNDLDPTTRANYALRRIETHNGISYAAYYLRRLDMTNTTADMEYRTVSKGVTVSTEFVPNNSNLNPTPPALSNTGTNVVTGDYVTATAKVNFSMSAAEVAEFMNVCNIIYGDPSYAIISEIALCSGVDKMLNGDFNGVTISYNEAIAVQINSLISAFFAMEFSNSGINYLFDMGATEPLYVLTT